VLQTVKDGKELLATGTPVFKDEKISLVIVNVRDVTELNNLKKELEQTKNMSHEMIRELEALRTEQNLTGNLLLDSPAMHKIIKLAQKVAKVDSTVLILGESGVGKGVLSKFIHENSNRSSKPFIKIDCSAIPESLIESELFGYERGAFSGAEKSGKLGLVEMADGGTLFLDEIGELPLNLQVKLLRLLQDSEFIRVGGKEPIPVNIRVIAATNRNLEQLMEEKRFREDLFYRLNVIPIFIPPLRERREDIYPLIMNFLDIFNRKCNEKKQVDPAAMKILMNNQWPGNVRELENMIERLVVTSNDNNISVHDLPAHLLKQGDPELLMIGETYRQCMDNYEKKLLAKILEVAPNTTDMSRILGIDTSTIRRKLKKHGIDY
jgi:transcriptional regulator with PAS, ATPase and Fis domain